MGEGKYGVVNQARHKQTGQEVAVKIVKKKDLSLNDLELLKREIEVLKVCQHPTIYKMYDVFENEVKIFIVAELLKGGDLFNYLSDRSFMITESRASQIAHQIATALYYLHSFGIAHRDIKPENILLKDNTEDSEVSLVDFGLSKTFGPGETCNDPYGTLCYVAPEILLGKHYEKTVDIWSFGVVVYLLLGRHLPFDSLDEKEIGVITIKNEISFEHEVWDPVSKEAKDLLLKLLDKNP